MAMKMNMYTVDSFYVCYFGWKYCWPHWILVCKGQSNNIYFAKRQYIIVIDRFHSKHWKYSITVFEYLGSMLSMSINAMISFDPIFFYDHLF